MTKEQKEARALLRREREEAGLPVDMDELIERYREADPEYARRLEAVIGPSERKSQGK